MELVRQEVGRVRQGAKRAWILVAAMAACVVVAVGWTTHRITRADAEIHIYNQGSQLRVEAGRLLVERDKALRLTVAKWEEGEEKGGYSRWF